MSQDKSTTSAHGPIPLAPALEKPIASPADGAVFGSDIMAQTLRELDIPYIALNPGASYRGLHDSLVNYLGNESPRMLLCLHEEHAVAIAQGYAKVTGKPMAAAVHSNVGLMHATMAIFNAWCDRMPVVVLGATGPVDAMKRRPWIDWIHTARDQGALVRSYVKWDDQPASVGAARESLARATWHAKTAPQGPVYVVLDAGLQEEPVKEPLAPWDPQRFIPSVAQSVDEHTIAQICSLLSHAKKPMIFAGRGSRALDAWNDRITLAERLGARVITDPKVAACFPTDHGLHVGAPATFGAPEALAAIRESDVILSLDWVDLGGTLRTAFGKDPISAKVINVSLDHILHNGWSMDHQSHPPVDVMIAADADFVVKALVGQLGDGPRMTTGGAPAPLLSPPLTEGEISVDQVAPALREVVGERDVSLLQTPLSWNGASWYFRHPLDYLGSDGGGGIGSGPGVSIGAALALRGSGRLPVSIFGDGNFMMGVSAIWTAVHYQIPLLIIVTNNQSFYNDEVHQERVARMRNRPVENKWIGQRMSDPELDLATIARGQGAEGFGPVKDARDLVAVLRDAVKAVDAGKVAVVDVRVRTGYAAVMTTGLTRS
jgi:thiamine pyrophosphate-dependent acetolactate synthase large subunit-like protein